MPAGGGGRACWVAAARDTSRDGGRGAAATSKREAKTASRTRQVVGFLAGLFVQPGGPREAALRARPSAKHFLSARRFGLVRIGNVRHVTLFLFFFCGQRYSFSI